MDNKQIDDLLQQFEDLRKQYHVSLLSVGGAIRVVRESEEVYRLSQRQLREAQQASIQLKADYEKIEGQIKSAIGWRPDNTVVGVME